MGTEAPSKMNFKRVIAKNLSTGLKRYSNAHKGESCYIFGDGPSIKWFDLEALGNYPAICCNKIGFHKDFDKLDVRYYSIVEPWLFCPAWAQRHEYHRQYGQITAELREIIKRRRDVQFFVNWTNCFAITGANLNYVWKTLPDTNATLDKRLEQFHLFGGTIYAALSLAYFMGFEKVYMVGFDAFTAMPAIDSHWYEYGAGNCYDSKNDSSAILSIFREHMAIFTILPFGEARQVDGILYNEHTGQDISYKENYEILSEHNLSVLASFPEYKIYPSNNGKL